jgi:hypothetical protein
MSNVKNVRQAEPPKGSTFASRQERLSKLAAKEALITRWLQTEGGLMKIGANLANPVRELLDYRGIARQLTVVEQIPDGVPIYFDRDLPRVPSVTIAKDGATRLIEMRGTRVNMEAFEIAGRPKIPYAQLYTLRYRPIARTKDRLIESMELQEDLIWFGLFETASTLVNPTFDSTGKLEKQDLARAYANIEDHRLVVRNTLMSAFGTASIRSWVFQDIDQLGLQEIRETGYLGQIWGSNFWVNDQLPDGVVYILAQPKFLGWFPVRKDIEVIPANDPDNLQLGFVGYELVAANLFNPLGVAKFTFNPDLS